MTVFTKNKYIVAFAATAVLAVGLYGCGGGGGNGNGNGPIINGPTKVTVDLDDLTSGYMADAIMMLEIKEDTYKDHGDIRFHCADGGGDCTVMVMVADDGVITAQSSGGTVTAEDAPDPGPNSVRDQKLDAAINMDPPSLAPSTESDGTPTPDAFFSSDDSAVYADIPGWTYEAYMRPNPTMGDDTLVVYRNTDPEKSVPFTDVYPLDFDSDADNVLDALGNIASLDPMLVGGEMLQVGYAYGETFEGTFDGGSGTYMCSDATNGCTLAFDASGNVIAVTGTMHFTPDADAMVLAPDPDFMYFGYWMNESTDANNYPDFKIAGLYGGAEPTPYADVQQLEGSATYEGSATGLYVRRWTDENSNVLRRRTGQFTADVALSANFGGGSIAMDDHFQISGTIDEFMDGTKEVDPSWRLTLESAEFEMDDSFATAFSGDTQAAGTGNWNGHFFGPVTPDDPTTGDVDETVRPSGVAGTFDGHFNNGDVIGAFGAERQDEQQ